MGVRSVAAVQGLALRLRNPHVRRPEGYTGSIAVADVSSPAVMLWMDSAPPVVQAYIERVDGGGELRISNRWRRPDGREDEWLNNYGMLIEEEEEDRCFLLRYSDGVGKQPTFDDLVVRVGWRPT